MPVFFYDFIVILNYTVLNDKLQVKRRSKRKLDEAIVACFRV